jgi:hypothetical protein
VVYDGVSGVIPAEEYGESDREFFGIGGIAGKVGVDFFRGGGTPSETEGLSLAGRQKDFEILSVPFSLCSKQKFKK